ncbi:MULTISPECIES: polysaccharide deacetylase family protein [unclassified Mycobacterium]|uniref:polysaccharide deacetylase family protein n=1 Tax=unclassified Mycobacterium TaxID=2642494 RepID=UPI0029C8C20F|nr:MULTISPECIES: polysaccharide deacetylase family protein [unclassified Mycobacterium]
MERISATGASACRRMGRQFALAGPLIAVCVLVAGCGITLRTPAHPESPTQTVAAVPTDPYVKPDGKPVPLPASTEPLILDPGQTVVSITFDDGWASAATAAEIMTAHGLTGTFYANSGTIGRPNYLSLAGLKSIAASGQEVGGHSLTHPDLADLPGDEARRQICDDRKTLLGWGFAVRNFAYPFGSATPEIEDMVRACGYNSARSLDELRPHRVAELPQRQHCQLCDVAEAVPPVDPMNTRAPREVEGDWTIADLEGQVEDAMAVGGWLPLTFHKLCTTDCTDASNQLPDSASVATPQAEFEDFVSWLATQQSQGSVLVRTVGDVIGGPVQPAVAGPVAPPAPSGTNGVANPALEEPGPDGVPACWARGGFGTNSPEFSLVPGAHSGATASRLVMRDYVDGDAKLLQTMDLGTCAPAVSPGGTYTIQASYTATVPTAFSVQYRLARGIWVYGVSSPEFAPATQFTAARWTLPPIPEGVTAVSFGLTLTQNGELVTDDYSLVAGTP